MFTDANFDLQNERCGNKNTYSILNCQIIDICVQDHRGVSICKHLAAHNPCELPFYSPGGNVNYQ